MKHPYLRKKGERGVGACYPYDPFLATRSDMIPVTQDQFELIRDGQLGLDDLDKPPVTEAEAVESTNTAAAHRARRLMDMAEEAEPEADPEPEPTEDQPESLPNVLAGKDDDQWCAHHGLPTSGSTMRPPSRKKAIRDFGLQAGAAVPGNWAIDKTIETIREQLGEA